MFNKTVLNIIRFLVLILLQVLIINKLNLGPLIQVFVYPLFILLLPFKISGIALLFLSFLLGLSIDLFTATIGLHAAASVFTAFMRESVLKLIAGLKNYDDFQFPGINNFGLNWFIQFSFLMMLFHNIVYFTLDAFSFSYFGNTLLRIFISTFVSSFAIVLLDILFKNNES